MYIYIIYKGIYIVYKYIQVYVCGKENIWDRDRDRDRENLKVEIT